MNPNLVHVIYVMRPKVKRDRRGRFASTGYGVGPAWALPDVGREDREPMDIPATFAGRWTLSDSGDIPAHEGDYDFRYREVIADLWATADEIRALREEWSLSDPEPTGGFLMASPVDGMPTVYPDERYDIDGSDWNVGGWTPIMFATVSIVGPDARPA